jgi:hypothetical protein
MATDDNKKIPPQNDVGRRDMLKGAFAGAATVGLSASDTSSAQAQAGADVPKSPYGGGAEHRLTIPILLQAHTISPEPEQLFPRQ